MTEEQNDWLEELLRWTEANLNRHITLQEASQQTHFARDYFCHRFKELTNTSYIRYVNQRRMERACEMLQAGATVETVARSCGITCIPYFVQLFKRQYNITPTRYRADAAGKKTEHQD